ncbi:MAG: serine hydrolase [Maribacter sp.]
MYSCLLLIFGTISGQGPKTPTFVAKELDTFIEKGLEQWDIPGLAIGIVKDGKLIKAKGYGVKEWEKQQKVDINTLFLIGSNTKGFTGILAALLEHEGKLDLDKPVIAYLPWFRMYDPNVTALISTKDMLAHRSGLGTFQGDFVQWNSTLTRKEAIKKMSLMPPKLSFRNEFGYCNYCYIVTGEVLEAVEGKSWERQIQERFFGPLGMNRSLTKATAITTAENTARAHTYYNDTLSKIPIPSIDAVSAAGSMASSVNDLAKWATMLLDNGKFDGQQVVPEKVLQKVWYPETIRSVQKKEHIPSTYNHYGLGFILADYDEALQVYHGGGTDGFISEVSLLPKENLGIIILTNTDASGLFNQAIKYQILAAYTGQPAYDYNAHYLKLHQEERQTEADRIQREWAATLGERQPELPLERYTGTYYNKVYGDIEIKEENGKLTVHFSNHPEKIGVLAPKGTNAFLTRFNYPGWGIQPTSFEVAKGKVTAFEMGVSPFIEHNRYVFTKK